MSLIKIIGVKLLRQLNFIRVSKLIEFIKGLETLNPEVLELYPSLSEELLREERQRISVFRKRLISEMRDRIDDKISGSVSKP